MAKNNYGKAREAVSSTFFMLICIIMPTMILLIAIISFIDINTFLGVDKNIVNNLNLIMAERTRHQQEGSRCGRPRLARQRLV